MADVAGGEHTWHARLEEKRTAIERRCATLRNICSREDESLLIPFDVRWKPIGVRLCSDQERPGHVELARLGSPLDSQSDVATVG